MKIQGRKQITPLGVTGPLSGPSFREVEETPEAQASDQVDLSSTQQLRRLNEAAQALPEVRMEKVEGLRGQIEDGNYYVESEKLARKVVDEALNEMLFSTRQS
ncbi:flagellar biosynthesis anti-sigma factor FlgM [bacterium]|nr:flagellar biosynthesis anti-sigma factor FlgM [bacterium]